jgi:hypothetical protein
MREILAVIIVTVLGGWATSRPEEAQLQGWRAETLVQPSIKSRYFALIFRERPYSGASGYKVGRDFEAPMSAGGGRQKRIN